MQRFKRVLVCIDGDGHAELAIERGAALASGAGAYLKVFHARRASRRWRGMFGCAGCVPVGRPRSRGEQVAWLDVPLYGRSIPLVMAESRGSPGLEITREVLRGDHDAVVHVERGSGPRWFRATTTVQLARLCPCPLWVIRPTGCLGREHVLAAVSLSPQDSALDREVVDTALATARLLRRPLHLVHAWDAPGIHLLAFHSCPEDLARYTWTVMQQHQEQLDELVSHYRAAIPRERVHLRRGRPVEVIPRVAAALSADPIVMGTAARRGIAGFLVGNTAERIVYRSVRSVLIVKSPDFVSPAAAPPMRAQALPSPQVSVLS